MMEAKAHDKWAKFYDFVFKETYGSYYDELTMETLKIIKSLVEKGTIIDYGAGTGRLSIPLSKEGYRVIAVEKSKGMVNELKRKMNEERVNFDVYNCSISDFKNGKGDLALAVFTVLNYSITEEELAKTLENIAEHLKAGGYFFFDLPKRVFFEIGRLTDIDRDGLRRTVDVKKKTGDIYLYIENTEGVFKGENFHYYDEFEIRYWKADVVEDILLRYGFRKIQKDLSVFGRTGSEYFVFQK